MSFILNQTIESVTFELKILPLVAQLLYDQAIVIKFSLCCLFVFDLVLGINLNFRNITTHFHMNGVSARPSDRTWRIRLTLFQVQLRNR